MGLSGSTAQLSVAPPPAGPSASPWVLLCALVVPNALLVSYINVALPEIQKSFGVASGTLSWATAGYIIAGAIGAVVSGRVADVFGIRRSICACIAGFLAASAAVTFAPTFPLLVASRVAEGMFGMSLAALAVAAVARTVPEALRPGVMGMVLGSFGSGLVAGSVGGGALIDAIGWRYPFLIAGALAGILFGWAWRLLPRDGAVSSAPFDFQGCFFVVVAVGTTLIWVNREPIAPSSPLTLTFLALALTGWLAFWYWIRRPAAPFIDPLVLRNRSFLAGCGIVSCAQGLFAGAGFLIPLAMHHELGFSAAKIGVVTLPAYVCLALSGFSARWVLRALRTPAVLMSGAGLAIAAALAFFLAGIGHDVWVMVLCFSAWGAVYSLLQSSITARVSTILPDGYTATGLGFFTFSYFAMGAVSVAAAGSLAQARRLARHPWSPFAPSVANGYADALTVLMVFAVSAVALSFYAVRLARASRLGHHPVTTTR